MKINMKGFKKIINDGKDFWITEDDLRNNKLIQDWLKNKRVRKKNFPIAAAGATAADAKRLCENAKKKVCLTYNGEIREIFVLRGSGSKKKVIKFIRWMYNDKGDLYLRRKYAKVQDQIC